MVDHNPNMERTMMTLRDEIEQVEQDAEDEIVTLDDLRDAGTWVVPPVRVSPYGRQYRSPATSLVRAGTVRDGVRRDWCLAYWHDAALYLSRHWQHRTDLDPAREVEIDEVLRGAIRAGDCARTIEGIIAACVFYLCNWSILSEEDVIEVYRGDLRSLPHTYRDKVWAQMTKDERRIIMEEMIDG